MNIYLLLIHLIESSSSSSLLYHASSRSLHFTCTTDGSLSGRAPLLPGEWQRGRVPLLPSHLLSWSDFLGTEAGQGAGGWGREGGLWQQPCQLDLLKKKSPSSVEREPWNALNCWAPVSHSHPSPPESPIRSNLITAPGAWLGSK